MKVELLNNTQDDLFISNTARVSFAKWKDEFDKDDEKLIKYLADHKHTSPFRHVRCCIRFPKSVGFENILEHLSPFESAGMVMKRMYGDMFVKHSVLGWSSIAKHPKCSKEISGIINLVIEALTPSSAKSLGLEFRNQGVKVQGFWNFVPENRMYNLDDPWFIDMSFRCECPIYIARQLVKHQVALSWNEFSRRYVDFPVTCHDQEFRYRPEDGIKQGSGGPVPDYDVPHVKIDGVWFDIEEVNRGLLEWYDNCVEAKIAPETVRAHMPLSMMTQFIWTGPLPAFAHMVNLRADDHAQKEVREFAKKMEDEILTSRFADDWAYEMLRLQREES